MAEGEKPKSRERDLKSGRYEDEHYAKRVFIAPKDKKRRECLRCGKKFLSHGIQNRICEPCANSVEFW